MLKRVIPPIAILVGGLFSASFLRAQSPIQFSPSSITLAANAGSSAAATTLVVTSSTERRFSVNASGSSGSVTWLSVSPSGTLYTPQTLSVVANPAGLAAATYNGIVTIRTGETNHRVPVTFTVTQRKTLTVTPAALTFSSAFAGTNAAAQTISVSANPNTSFTLGTGGASWLSVTSSSGTTPATVTVAPNAAGLGSGSYSASITVTGNGITDAVPVGLTISQATQAISFSPSSTISPTTFPFSVSLAATGGGSGNPVTFSVSAGPAIVSGASLNITGAGTIAVCADQAGNNNYLAAPEVCRSITVIAASQTISFTAPASVAFGASPIPLQATASSGLPVTLTASPSGVCSVSGSSLTVASVGSCAVTASQTGNSNYSAATPVTRTVVVDQASQAITFAPLTTPVTFTTGLTVPLTATASSGLPVTFSVDALSTGSGSISGSNLTISGAGSFVIDANQAGNANYAAAAQVQQTLAVNPAPTLSLNPTSLAFSAATGAQPSGQSIAISSNSTTTFTAVAAGASWLSVSPSSGSLPATLTVSASTNGLSTGSFAGAITITTANGLSGSVPVSLAITASNPGLTVSPSSLSYSAAAGESSQALDSINVSANSATGFTVSTSGLSWLSASPSSATTPATIAVTADVTGITAGTYAGSVAVSGGNSTVTIPVTVTVSVATSGPFRVVGWNDLGMHCFDGKDYSTFAVLPPYNTIHAQLIDTSGSLVTDSSNYTIEYAAITDPLTNTISSTSAQKTNFWDYSSDLGLGSPDPDVGITGNAMPGKANKSQPMSFSASDNTWVATGIPQMPYADNGTTNYFPMMRVTARNSSGAVVATTDIVTPTSDEMSCRSCHASNSNPNAMPKNGWVNNPDPATDVKLNILRRHDDDQQPTSLFQSAATSLGFNTAGLEATVRSRPILCAQCHASNALGMAGFSGVAPLTQAMHGRHAAVVDPATNATMDSSTLRATCYNCHPGPNTKCLRGAMANLQTASGANAIECQSCHGNLTAVANPSRSGWLTEPNCQSCHSGLASSTNTTLAYTSVFSSGTTLRTPADTTFATNPNTPATGVSLYRYSSGHGGLQCESCHGSTHAEFPTSIVNDNVQSTNLQGHSGVLVECSTCHKSVPSTSNGGPHGLHPVGTTWVSQHPDIAQHQGTTTCQGCHGTDYRGTTLSRVQTNRTLAGKSFTTGTIIGCYSCHNGPNGD